MADDQPAPIVLGWDDVTGAVDVLAGRVRAGATPDVLVGVLRGGLVPAVLLSHRIGVRWVRAVAVTHTVDDHVGAAKTPTPRVNTPGSLGDLTGMDVLVVDDIAGSGDTLACVVGLARTAGAARVRTAVLAVNHAHWHRPQPPARVVTYLGAVADRWVIFPWEATA